MLVALAAAGGCAAMLRGPSSQAPPSAGVYDEAAPPDAAGLAQLAVRRWLTHAPAQPDALGARRDGAANGARVGATDAVASRRVGERYWAVTVAVDIDRPGDPLGPWFFEIGVVDTDAGLAVTGAPAVVPPPVRAELDVPASRWRAVHRPDDEAAATAQAFLDALLTGRGDLARYLAPGVRLAPVTPAFDAVRVVRSAHVDSSPDRRVVQAEAVATSAGLEVPLAYELVLERRAGRWEVRALSGAPTLRRRVPAASATSSTTSVVDVATTTTTTPARPGA